jgi:nitrate reductase gamma subunit
MDGPSLIDTARALVTFKTTLPLSYVQATAMTMAASLVAYIPMTHMAHFIVKYFAYHCIRWGDRPRGGDPVVERAVAEYLKYTPTWSATHIRSGRSATWGEIVVDNPTREKSK